MIHEFKCGGDVDLFSTIKATKALNSNPLAVVDIEAAKLPFFLSGVFFFPFQRRMHSYVAQCRHPFQTVLFSD